MQQLVEETLELQVRDVTRQNQYRVANLETGWSVGELVNGLVTRMNLKPEDSQGRPHTYEAFLERTRQHLNPSSQVGDVLESGDEIVLQPYVAAGISMQQHVNC